MLRNMNNLPRFKISLTALSAALLFCTIYFFAPGVLTYDSASVLTYISDLKFKRLHAPAFQYFWYMILPFSKSQLIPFFINSVLYWYSILCFSLSLAPKNKIIATSFFIIGLLPNMIFMNHVINFDVITNHLLLAFFSTMACHITYQKKFLLTFSLVFATLFMLARYNSLISLVPVTLFWSYENNSSEKTTTLFKKFVILLIVMTALHISVTKLFFNKPQNYFKNITARYDLVGMSIDGNHSGITKDLPKDLQEELSRIYNENGWFLGQPMLHKTFKSYDVVDEWKKSIIKSPITYLKVRVKTSYKMFSGNTFVLQQCPLFYWHHFSAGNIPNFLKEKFAEKQWSTSNLTKNKKSFNGFTKTYGEILISYFKRFPSSLWIACLGMVEFIALLYLAIIKKYFSQSTRIALFMTATALAWYAPLIVLVQIPMVRYVYPANSLVLASLPFMLRILTSIRSSKV